MIVRATSEEILKRFTALEEENQRLREETEQLREENKRFRAKLWWHEGAYTPPSKERSADEEPRTDGGTPGRKDGHEPEWQSTADPDEEIEVTRDCCPECGDHLGESGADIHRLAEVVPDPQPPEVTQYNRHYYQCESPGTGAVATHPDRHDGQFGVNVVAQPALTRYDYHRPSRKIIGTLRNDRGIFAHETVSSLLAPRRQQGRNPYEELKRVVRDNGTISRDQAAPVVDSSG